ncbi:gfo/Idh/MocA family oxidoreductase [Paenibacillaceae bacterium]|nr:gfo/Idh/MocA family oxidoreductase [Paenibacillaceae bacterium]
MIRIAMLSYWHVHAWDYTKQAQNHPDVEIVAVWDEEAERGQASADKLGVPFFADLDQLLANPDIDAVIVDTPTNLHYEVMVKAAQAGKHIFTEKVIAPTLQEVNGIIEAVKSANVKLTVSLPRLNDNYTLAIQEVLEQNLLGELTLARVRLSHNGAIAGWLPEHFYNAEQCGGGALIDLGCHPMYLTRLFLGMPDSVSAHYGYVSGKEVEDNAVAVLKYSNGALGIVEAGFVNAHSPFSIEIHGTEGTLLYGTPEPKLLLRSNKNDAGAWTELAADKTEISAFDQFVQHVQNNTEATENVGLAVDLTALMESANRSVRENKAISINELEK